MKYNPSEVVKHYPILPKIALYDNHLKPEHKIVLQVIIHTMDHNYQTQVKNNEIATACTWYTKPKSHRWIFSIMRHLRARGYVRTEFYKDLGSIRVITVNKKIFDDSIVNPGDLIDEYFGGR